MTAAAKAGFSESVSAVEASSMPLLLPYLPSAEPPSLTTAAAVVGEASSAGKATSPSASTSGLVSTCEAEKSKSRPLGAEVAVATGVRGVTTSASLELVSAEATAEAEGCLPKLLLVTDVVGFILFWESIAAIACDKNTGSIVKMRTLRLKFLLN